MRYMMLMIPAGYEKAPPGTMPEDTEAVSAMMKYNEAQQGRGGTNRYELHRADASGEITDKVTVGHHERELFYDHRNSVALGRTSVLMPHTAREEQGEDGPLEFSVLSVPLDGDGEDAVWIEVARYEEFEHSSSAEHSLLPVPGAVISYSEATEVNTIHGLVP